MKDISIGIYHKDHQYGKRLMEYLNHQKDFPMTASFTSDEIGRASCRERV